MKVFGIIVALLFAVIFIGGCGVLGSAVALNNNMVAASYEADEKGSTVGVQCTRRADLLPNLAAVVGQYAKHEKGTFEAVAQARASVGQVRLDPSKLGSATPEQMNQFAAAQQSLGNALSRLMVVAEKYPELKADSRFAELQAQVEGAENRIAVARRDYNIAVKAYNTMIGQFPGSLVAGFRAFQLKAFFEMPDANAAKAAPVLKF